MSDENPAINTENPSIAEAKAAYYANSGYDIPGGGIAMACAFVQACRILLVLLSKRVSHGGRAEETEIDPTVIERQIVSAKRWIYAQQARERASVQHIARRGEPFFPTYPGPYYG